jgi:hypothetical protein
MKVFYEAPDVTLYHGMAADYDGPRPDLILTNPYGPLPASVVGVPMLLHQWWFGLGQLVEWTGVGRHRFSPVGLWSEGREVVWAANIPPGEVSLVELRDLVPTPEGWWPLELPTRLLAAYGWPGALVLDLFCGRATGGRAARAAGMRYLGVDLLEAHLAEAVRYLEGRDA